MVFEVPKYLPPEERAKNIELINKTYEALRKG